MKTYQCNHDEVETTYLNDYVKVLKCMYCGETFTDNEYDTLLEQHELESMVQHLCGIKGKKVC
jgi:hypothetical protein